MAAPRGADLRLDSGGRASRGERRERYADEQEARRAARQELEDERRSGIWTDPADER
jgi:GTP-binding protein